MKSSLPLAVGGMGEGSEARDRCLNRTVAINRPKSQRTVRFEEETNAIAALRNAKLEARHPT